MESAIASLQLLKVRVVQNGGKLLGDHRIELVDGILDRPAQVHFPVDVLLLDLVRQVLQQCEGGSLVRLLCRRVALLEQVRLGDCGTTGFDGLGANAHDFFSSGNAAVWLSVLVVDALCSISAASSFRMFSFCTICSRRFSRSEERSAFVSSS